MSQHPLHSIVNVSAILCFYLSRKRNFITNDGSKVLPRFLTSLGSGKVFVCSLPWTWTGKAEGKKSGSKLWLLCEGEESRKQTNKQTNKQTDRQTDRQNTMTMHKWVSSWKFVHRSCNFVKGLPYRKLDDRRMHDCQFALFLLSFHCLLLRSTDLSQQLHTCISPVQQYNN